MYWEILPSRHDTAIAVMILVAKIVSTEPEQSWGYQSIWVGLAHVALHFPTKLLTPGGFDMRISHCVPWCTPRPQWTFPNPWSHRWPLLNSIGHKTN